MLKASSFAYRASDTDGVRLEKTTIFLVASSCCVAGCIWALMYALVFGWGFTTFLPMAFVVVVGTSLVVAHLTKNHYYAVYTQIVCIIYIPALVQWSIGGVFASGFVMAWAFCGPVMALVFFPPRKSFLWFGMYLLNMAITLVFDDAFASRGYEVADSTRVIFFIMNLSVSSLVIFLFASNFVASAITERRRADSKNADLASARDEAEAANRAKSLFLANMSHEIRTPMNAILGYAQVLVRADNLLPEHHRAVDTIFRSGEHLLGLINEVLDISKIEAGRLQLNIDVFDLGETIQSIGRMFAPRCNEKELAWHLEAALPAGRVRGDGLKLRQVLINLLGNAVKFTSSGQVRLRVAAQGGDVYLFEVRDTGPGIPAEKHERIFEPFRQEEDGGYRGGTGLGLAITRAYVEVLGGRVQLESTVGEGSRFSFALCLPPAEESAIPQDVDWSRVRQLAPGPPIHALVVDDVEANREILEHFLRSLGVQTQTASSGVEALEQVRWHRPDIVFLDIRMPGMGGQEVLAQLLTDRVEGMPKVIAVTASVLDHERLAYIEQGFDDFLGKPLLAATLYACLAEQLGVEFVYAEEEEKEATDGWQQAILSEALRTELGEALRQRSATRLRTVFVQLSAEAPALAAHLDPLLRRYDMEGIQAVLERSGNLGKPS